ncbi:MAG: hypothetical protein RL641_242 [Candidatus Parcubacteria bacterium]|jgi:undecaprenyl-diphosphatase
MTILHAIIFGIVEGLTEFLPISSTAHLDITRAILSLPSSEFLKTFEIGIQTGAILAVLILYGKKLFSSWRYFRNISLAFVPTAIIGFFLYKIIKEFLLGNVLLAAIMIFVGGVVIVLLERVMVKRGEKSDDIRTIESFTTKELVILGTSQALAVVPGVSRSGAVIITGRLLGIPKSAITEFSFVLAVPTILAATGYDLFKTNFTLTNLEWLYFAIGFTVSFIVALAVVRWLLVYIQRHSFAIFGWYRIIFSLLVLLFLLS